MKEVMKRYFFGILTALLASAYCSWLILIILSFLSLVIPLFRAPIFFNTIWIIASVSALFWIAGNPNIYKNPASK